MLRYRWSAWVLGGCLGFLVIILSVRVEGTPRPRPDAGTPRDAAAAPGRVTRAFSDAWNWNETSDKLLALQEEKIRIERAERAERRKVLLAQGKTDFQLDITAGDAFDEKTLEIHRR